MRAYVFWMGVAAALGMGKLILLAQLLPSISFGYYAAMMGAAGVLTALFSFGWIEGSIKPFPRHWTDGRHDLLVGRAKSIAVRVSHYAGIIILAGVAVGVVVDGVFGGALVLLTGVLGLLSVFARIASALNLAIGEEILIQSFSVYRAISSLGLAVGGALIGGWEGAVAGEIIAVLVNIGQGVAAVRRRLPLDAPRVPSEVDARLYLSALMTTATGMGDRPIVAALGGPTLAGSYAFAMIIAQVGQVFVNIIGQKIGPDIVRSIRRHSPFAAVASRLSGPLLATVALGALAFACAMVGRHVPYISDAMSKYDLGLAAVAASCVAFAAYFYVILEYAVIAVDEERGVFAASAAALIAFAAGCAVAYFAGAAAEGYLWAFAAARAVQAIVLASALVPRRQSADG